MLMTRLLPYFDQATLQPPICYFAALLATLIPEKRKSKEKAARGKSNNRSSLVPETCDPLGSLRSLQLSRVSNVTRSPLVEN
jgi:hypothetical protein